MNATFIDPGAAEFLRPNLSSSKNPEESTRPVKRHKYTVDECQVHCRYVSIHFWLVVNDAH